MFLHHIQHFYRLKNLWPLLCFFCPCLWVFRFYNAPVISSTGLFFLSGSLLMRMVGCCINDICDRDIDRKTHRTKDRPLACGALSIKTAIILSVIPVAGACILFLYLNRLSQIMAIIGFILTIAYPFGKRFFKAPQVILALCINMGTWITWSELSGDVVHINNILLLYGRGFFWTLFYDTMYGYQDLQDDKKNNIQSLSILNEKHPKMWFLFYHLCMCICDWEWRLFLIGFILIMLWTPHKSRLISRAVMCMGCL